MKFSEIVDQASGLLQRKGRITYRALKLEFALTDEQLDVLKEELIDGQQVAVDEGGRVLVWKGADPSSSFLTSPTTQPQAPANYTPPHLAERIRAELTALEARRLTDGERKTITALFVDLKGSTALIEGLDPEEARAIIDPALQLMMDAVHYYEGYVAQALGDGIFALFGAPIAHEDHPQRAVYAALRMQDAMRRYADTLRAKGHPPLQMRVGINTGEVVVRSIRKDDLHTDYVPVGHSTNLAARMEQLAAPGTIVVSAYTHRLTDGYFAFKDLGLTQIKGVEEPLHIYEVLNVGPLRTRLQMSARRGLTRFVGRQSELEQLQRALEYAKAGHGQIVGMMGEPGLGKSRLFHEFVGAYVRTPLLVLEAHSVSHGKAMAYLPVIELLKHYFRIESQDDERIRREKVTGKVLTLDRGLEDTLLYLFALLGIEEQPSPLQQMDTQIRRRRTFEALKKLFLRESLNQPLVLIFEDLHWIDEETQGFLEVLGESLVNAKLLLLTNYRPEYRHDWGQKTYYTQLRLAPLSKTEAEEFLDVLLGTTVGAHGRAPLQALKQLILDKTQGTPFFMEEIVQELKEQGVLKQNGSVGWVPTQPITALQIPPTVQGILAARIDRLAVEEKALLQQLSVIGRQFPVSMVRQVIAQPEADLYQLLASLQHKEFLYEQSAFPESEYIFKHAFTQDVAYSSVLIERRKALHERIALVIEQLYQDHLDEHYSALAHHYSRSGNIGNAIYYLQLTGQQYAQNSAHSEAVNHFTTALDLLKTLPATPEHAGQELALQLNLAASLQVTKGPSAAEVESAYLRARILCQHGGDERQLFSVLRGLWLLHHVKADLTAAHETGEQLLAMAEQIQDSALLLEARRTLGSTLLWQGEFSPARRHLEQAAALYNQQPQDSLNFSYGGADPGIVCLCELARVLWFLGYPDQAVARTQGALAIARQRSDPFSLGFALIFAAGLYQLRREGQLTQSYAEDGMTLARQYGFAALLSAGTIRRGWAFAEQGQEEEGLRQMQQGLTARQATGAELAQPYFLALQAEICGKLGQRERALTFLSEALAAMHASEEHRLEAELYRIKGDLLLAQEVKNHKSKIISQKSEISNTQHLAPDTQEEAEACFLKAIEVARKQQAKSLELRAMMSLLRLRQQQATDHASRTTHHGPRLKLTEAHRMLSEVYNWFIEGFDTKDLQEAKMLLEELE